MRLLESLTKFADDSSIHGLNYIAKSPSKTERIIWFILFTGALLYAGLQIGEEYRGKTYFLFFCTFRELLFHLPKTDYYKNIID